MCSSLQTADAGTPRYDLRATCSRAAGVLRAKGYTLRAALGAHEAPVHDRARSCCYAALAAGAGVELEAGRARGVRTPETTRAALKAVERLSKRVRREVERESYTALVCQLVFIEGDPLPADRVFTYVAPWLGPQRL